MSKRHAHPVLDRQIKERPVVSGLSALTGGRKGKKVDNVGAPKYALVPGVDVREIWPDSAVPMPSVTKTSIDVLSMVTVVIVNLNTKHLLKACFNSLYKAYPGIKTVVVDNGSTDGSHKMLRGMGNEDGRSKLVHFKFHNNIGHGPAMNRIIRGNKTPYAYGGIQTPYFFTLDTDTIIIKPGFMDIMLKWFQQDNSLYAVGWKRRVHRQTGVPADWSAGPKKKATFMDYIHPYAAMFRLSKYLRLPPFEHHGAPCLSNMREANKKGFGLKGMPQSTQHQLGPYIKHLTAGTRRMYSLPDWDPGDEKPGQWNKSEVRNI